MSSRISVLVLGGFVVWFAGCGMKSSEQPVAKLAGGVGVVDLDLVAKRLGRDIEIENLVKEKRASLSGELTTLQGSLNRLYEERREKLGDDPTEQQVKELQAWQDKTNSQLLDSKRKKDAELSAYHQKLNEKFREQARPVARAVAAARGLSIVVPKNPAILLTVDPAVDITDDVAAKMPASKSVDDDSEPAPAVSKKPGAETSSR